MTGFDRITIDPAVMGGKPVIRGMRVTVGMVGGQIEAGQTRQTSWFAVTPTLRLRT
jgi:uncharacterized protein (DUF433 family)